MPEFLNVHVFSSFRWEIFLFLFFASSILSIFLLLVGEWLFKKFHILDNPKKYGHTRTPIPYPMGIFFFVIFGLLTGLFFNLFYHKILLLLGFGFFITVVSFVDDRWNISSKFRLFMQVSISGLLSILALSEEIQIGYISNFLGGVIDLTQYYVVLGEITFYIVPFLFTVVWYVMVMNAMNWSDGIPGITSGLSMVAFLVILILSIKLYFFVDTTSQVKENTLFVIALCCVCIPPVCVMFFHEIQGKCLLGDSGTMFIAFIIASLAIISGGKIATVATVIGIYLIDAFYVILIRFFRGQSPMQGDQVSHFHHRLVNLGLSHNMIRIIIFSLAFLFGISAIFLDKTGKIIVFIILTVIVVFLTKIISLKK